MSGLKTRQQHEDLWKLIQQRRAKRELARLAPPLVEFWDGDYNLRGQVAGWRAVDYEFIENDTGTATIRLPLDHHMAKWVMNHRGRVKRNVHCTIEKQGSRWAGRMDSYTVVKRDGDAYLEVLFLHDYENVKHILCWANPFLRPEVQFPKLWVIFGPAKWCLLMTLFVNILRLETSLWTLPDNPLDPMEWMPLSFDVSQWRNIVKPFPLLGDNSNLVFVFSRFKTWHDTARDILEDAQLTVVCRRYLKDRDPHPFKDLAGEWNISAVEELLSLIPLRNGCLVWDIEDKSGWGEGTAFGGSLLTGFVRAVMQVASSGYTEGVEVYHGDPVHPAEYFRPEYLGTAPSYPWVVFREGPYTGIKSSEFTYYEATDTSFVTGGQSMPGVNEAFSAGINMAGDFLTSVINSAIPVAAWGGGVQFSIPSLGGAMDAVAKILYENTFLAFEEVPTLRAAGLSLPIAGLEDIVTGIGDHHYYEGWGDGADRAFTLGAQMAIRAKMWATRARSVHTLEVSDAAPYLIGEKGYGHFWLGDRVGTTVLGYPDEDMVFVERVKRLRYTWDESGPKGWQISIGYREPEDPALKALDWVRQINSALGTWGIL